MATKYQVTELDRALKQFKRTDEWTNEKQLEWQLRRSEESAIKKLERMAQEKSNLYVENVLLKKSMSKKEEEIEELKQAIHLYHDELKKPNHYEMGNELLMRDIKTLKTKVKKGKELISKLQSELTEYRNLKNTLHPLIERLWAIDSGDPLQIIKGEKEEIINTIAYRIANEWID